VVVEGVATEGVEDLVPPARVGRRRGVEDDGDQGPDVLDADGLEVEVGDQRVCRAVSSARTSGWRLVGGRGRGVDEVDDGLLASGDGEVALSLGNLTRPGVRGCAFALPSGGRGTDTLLGCRNLGLGSE
jgi:hypothetical protein